MSFVSLFSPQQQQQEPFPATGSTPVESNNSTTCSNSYHPKITTTTSPVNQLLTVNHRSSSIVIAATTNTDTTTSAATTTTSPNTVPYQPPQQPNRRIRSRSSLRYRHPTTEEIIEEVYRRVLQEQQYQQRLQLQQQQQQLLLEQQQQQQQSVIMKSPITTTTTRSRSVVGDIQIIPSTSTTSSATTAKRRTWTPILQRQQRQNILSVIPNQNTTTSTAAGVAAAKESRSDTASRNQLNSHTKNEQQRRSITPFRRNRNSNTDSHNHNNGSDKFDVTQLVAEYTSHNPISKKGNQQQQQPNDVKGSKTRSTTNNSNNSKEQESGLSRSQTTTFLPVSIDEIIGGKHSSTSTSTGNSEDDRNDATAITTTISSTKGRMKKEVRSMSPFFRRRNVVTGTTSSTNSKVRAAELIANAKQNALLLQNVADASGTASSSCLAINLLNRSNSGITTDQQVSSMNDFTFMNNNDNNTTNSRTRSGNTTNHITNDTPKAAHEQSQQPTIRRPRSLSPFLRRKRADELISDIYSKIEIDYSSSPNRRGILTTGGTINNKFSISNSSGSNDDSGVTERSSSSSHDEDGVEIVLTGAIMNTKQKSSNTSSSRMRNTFSLRSSNKPIQTPQPSLVTPVPGTTNTTTDNTTMKRNVSSQSDKNNDTNGLQTIATVKLEGKSLHQSKIMQASKANDKNVGTNIKMENMNYDDKNNSNTKKTIRGRKSILVASSNDKEQAKQQQKVVPNNRTSDVNNATGITSVLNISENTNSKADLNLSAGSNISPKTKSPDRNRTVEKKIVKRRSFMPNFGGNSNTKDRKNVKDLNITPGKINHYHQQLQKQQQASRPKLNLDLLAPTSIVTNGGVRSRVSELSSPAPNSKHPLTNATPLSPKVKTRSLGERSIAEIQTALEKVQKELITATKIGQSVPHNLVLEKLLAVADTIEEPNDRKTFLRKVSRLGSTISASALSYPSDDGGTTSNGEEDATTDFSEDEETDTDHLDTSGDESSFDTWDKNRKRGMSQWTAILYALGLNGIWGDDEIYEDMDMSRTSTLDNEDELDGQTDDDDIDEDEATDRAQTAPPINQNANVTDLVTQTTSSSTIHDDTIVADAEETKRLTKENEANQRRHAIEEEERMLMELEAMEKRINDEKNIKRTIQASERLKRIAAEMKDENERIDRTLAEASKNEVNHDDTPPAGVIEMYVQEISAAEKEKMAKQEAIRRWTIEAEKIKQSLVDSVLEKVQQDQQSTVLSTRAPSTNHTQSGSAIQSVANSNVQRLDPIIQKNNQIISSIQSIPKSTRGIVSIGNRTRRSFFNSGSQRNQSGRLSKATTQTSLGNPSLLSQPEHTLSSLTSRTGWTGYTGTTAPDEMHRKLDYETIQKLKTETMSNAEPNKSWSSELLDDSDARASLLSNTSEYVSTVSKLSASQRQQHHQQQRRQAPSPSSVANSRERSHQQHAMRQTSSTDSQVRRTLEEQGQMKNGQQYNSTYGNSNGSAIDTNYDVNYDDAISLGSIDSDQFNL